jgi:ribonuclease T2
MGLQVGTAFAAALSLALLAAGAAGAQDSRQNKPGEFDFYVLALSWSPSFCEASAERSAQRAGRRNSARSSEPPSEPEPGAEPSSKSASPTPPPQTASEPTAARRRPDPQCGARSFSFVVHGLWPQYQRGFPEFCETPAPRLNREIVSSMLDLMPSPRLVFRQWDRHGVCSGLSAAGYFEAVRKARAVVKIPAEYIDLTSALSVTPAEVEDAFVKANPGLSADGVTVGCDRSRLREVRICLTKEFKFQDCPEVNRRACRRDRLTMPPVRGG